VFKNKVLRRIYGPEKDELGRGWRKLRNENKFFYSLPNVIKMIKNEGG
jgi:hypothetical protein